MTSSSRVAGRSAKRSFRQPVPADVQKKLLEKLPADLVHEEIIHALFERDYTLIEAEIDAFRAGHRR